MWLPVRNAATTYSPRSLEKMLWCAVTPFRAEDRPMKVDDPLEVLVAPEFLDAAAELAAAMRRGEDFSIEEMSRKLGLPDGFLVSAAALWHALNSGKSITVHPVWLGKAKN